MEPHLPPTPAPRTPSLPGCRRPRPRRAAGLTRRVGVAPKPGRPPRTDDPYRVRRRMGMTADTRQRTDHTGTRRFSEGVEQLPDTAEKRVIGRFSRGIEHYPERAR